MSESTEITAEAGETTEQQATEFEAITSQDEFDRRLAARLDRERRKYADYPELQKAAERLREIEESNKTEAEKIAARAEAAEQRAAELEAKVLRSEVAAAKGVPAGLLTGSTQEELEAAADALIAFRGEQKATPSSPALGRVNGQTVKGTAADQFADFFAKQL